MKSKYVKYLFVAVLIIGLSTFSLDLMAQCPMCRAAAETNIANGGTEGNGLNVGILYMLAIPYLLMFGIGIVWWRRNGRHHKELD